uniref:Aminomethyltransferase n=1 Tax=Haptolina ericina TaxID=156174 RepID=A0A6T9MJR7_9EUKA|mmetsp:Transcript_6685/g.14949  ORF Transcript_6685/g.14949 Transcript_6685/m.14949 type:complete len:400 (+) Transcript_6685:38-1237(+)
MLRRSALSLGRSVRHFAAAAEGPLRKTPLHANHVALGGKMVEFGGWDMPVQYPAGIIESHMHTRKSAGLFDVSHMLGVVIKGKDRVEFMEKLCCADIKALPDGMGSLSMLTNEEGGVIDDMIVTNAGDHLYMVINAGHEEKDLPHINKYMAEFVKAGGDVSMETLADNGILALQGPKAAEVLQRLVSDDLTQMSFMSAKPMTVMGLECFVSRSGYTGEDGFEIAVPKGAGEKHGVVTLWESLLDQEEVLPVGLGARDSLRLEAGLCLYGNDLDDTTSPVEGTLLWVIAKRRRNEPGSFVGSERILSEWANKSATRKRAGFVIKGAPAREGTPIFDGEEQVGVVTSGSFSPCLKKGIGMCYVKTGLNKAGTELTVPVRNKKSTITITKMPFVEQNYYRGP